VHTVGSQTQYNECQYALHEAQHQDDEGLIEACHGVLLSVWVSLRSLPLPWVCSRAFGPGCRRKQDAPEDGAGRSSARRVRGLFGARNVALYLSEGRG